MGSPLLARIVREGGGKLIDFAAGKALGEGQRAGESKLAAGGQAKTKRSLAGKLAGAALARVATRSVPGAIVIAGGMAAKLLYDRRHRGKAGPADDAD